VTFKDGAATLGSGTLSAGKASLTTSALIVGSHSITAAYGGDSTYASSTSATATQTVSKGATTLSMSATPATVAPGAHVTLKATVKVTSPAAATPTGQVTFKDSGVTIGVATIASGVAQFTVTPISIGSHTVTASYPGDGHLTASSRSASFKVSAAVGAETRVNTTTAGSQQQPAVAALKSGYVVAWASNGQDKSGFGVYAQRYTSSGAKAGTEFLVNTVKTGDQSRPAVAGLTNGGFVAVWQSNGEDKSGLGIYGQRYTAFGTKSGTEFKINKTTTGHQSLPAVAPLTSGGFVVTWHSAGQDGSGLGVYAQRYDSAGKAAGSEFKVNKTTAGDQSRPSIAGLTGAAGTEFRVNTVTLHDQSLPSVARLSNGGFVVAWQSALQDGSGLGVYLQRYTSAGAKSGGETRVNATTVSDQSTPAASAFSNGGFVVAWASTDGSGQGIYTQAFSATGAKANVEFRANTTTAGTQYQPVTAAFASGNFIVVWRGPDSALEGIYSQRFLVPGTH
jgi:hypothetical protein